MKSVLAVILVSSFTVMFALSQEAAVSPYQRMLSLYETGMTDQAFSTFVGSLSKDEMKQLLREFAVQNTNVTQGIFEFMSVLSIPYYEHGAGASDGCTQWAEDVQDQSYPAEWRNVILGHPPFKTQSLTPGEVALFSNTLTSVAFSTNAPPGLRREALLGLQHVMSRGDYVDLLKDSASRGEDPRFRREALLQMSRIVYRGRLKSEQSPEFNKVANEYESLLSDMGSRTNLPPALDESVKLLKRQKKPGKKQG